MFDDITNFSWPEIWIIFWCNSDHFFSISMHTGLLHDHAWAKQLQKGHWRSWEAVWKPQTQVWQFICELTLLYYLQKLTYSEFHIELPLAITPFNFCSLAVFDDFLKNINIFILYMYCTVAHILNSMWWSSLLKHFVLYYFYRMKVLYQ